MQQLIIYLNERSSPVEDSAASDALAQWCAVARAFWAALVAVSRIRNDLRIIVLNQHWTESVADRPLCNWLDTWLGRDSYRKLQLKVLKRPTANTDLSEVYYAGARALGLTMAHLSDSWVTSFPRPSSDWLHPVIDGYKYEINEEGESESACNVRNLALEEHAKYWRNELIDWGFTIATANEIAVVEGHPIDMYPLDHGYPHVHLVDQNERRSTLAKFRIDEFARIEGPPHWDRPMQNWIALHRDTLLNSWGRCQRGEHPYSIT